MTETILSIVTLLLGGCNIWQFIFLRQERKKAIAAAEDAITDSKQKKFDFIKDQADYLIEKLDNVSRDYVELQRSIRETEAKHTQEILAKCSTIAELRSQVVYHKEFRCFKADCAHRQKVRTKDESQQYSDSENQGV